MTKSYLACIGSIVLGLALTNCGDETSGGTEATGTGGASTSTSTGASTGNTGGASTSTGAAGGSSSSGMGGTGSGMGGTGGTGGGMGGAGGGGSQAQAFCTDFGGFCMFTADWYVDEAGCEAAFNDYSADIQACVIMHLANAHNGMKDLHCDHAAGNGPCAP